jgi:hypothetical protein
MSMGQEILNVGSESSLSLGISTLVVGNEMVGKFSVICDFITQDIVVRLESFCLYWSPFD